MNETPEKIANEIVSEVQLIDNTPDDAIREGRELRASVAAAIRNARLAGARAALAWVGETIDRHQHDYTSEFACGAWRAAERLHEDTRRADPAAVAELKIPPAIAAAEKE